MTIKNKSLFFDDLKYILLKKKLQNILFEVPNDCLL